MMQCTVTLECKVGRKSIRYYLRIIFPDNSELTSERYWLSAKAAQRALAEWVCAAGGNVAKFPT